MKLAIEVLEEEIKIIKVSLFYEKEYLKQLKTKSDKVKHKLNIAKFLVDITKLKQAIKFLKKAEGK